MNAAAGLTRAAGGVAILLALTAYVTAQLPDGSPAPVNATLEPGSTIVDEIEDEQERSAFRSAWQAGEPQKQRDLGIHFIEQYPRSLVLREAYELVARACFALGDDAGSLDWASRSLRLMPENPILLVMVADAAARLGRLDLAETSARDAVSYLADADAPVTIPTERWPRVRDDLRARSQYVLGRVSALRERYADAEVFLLEALRLTPDDLEALYVFGLARMELQKNDEDAATPLARVMDSKGPLSNPARRALRVLYERRRGSSAATFDEYVTSVKRTLSLPAAPAPIAGPSGAYAGSSACQACHPREYERWLATGMSKMFRPYRPEDVIGDFSGRQTVLDHARPITDDGRHFIEMRDKRGTEWTRYPVDYIIGSKWQQAYATRLSDGRFLVFPIQYSRIHSIWLNYWKTIDRPDSMRSDLSRFHEIPPDAVYQTTCASCHTSQLKFQNSPSGGTSAVFRAGGINCEMCHGPSLAHVEAKKSGRAASRSAAEPPVSFRRLPAAQSTAICAQCHAQSAVHDSLPGGAKNYSEQAPFYRTYATYLPSNFARSTFYRDGRYRSTTFISEAFARSQCFRTGGGTCVSCHDPHPPDASDNPTSLKFRADPNQMCLQCHEQLRDRPERHTRHAPGTEASQCVSCHMPRIMDALMFRARSHEIDDIPDADMTTRFGPADSPNACLECHRDRDTAWLQRELKEF